MEVGRGYIVGEGREGKGLGEGGVFWLFIITEKSRVKERKWDGVGVMKDKELKSEDVKDPHTLEKKIQ